MASGHKEELKSGSTGPHDPVRRRPGCHSDRRGVLRDRRPHLQKRRRRRGKQQPQIRSGVCKVSPANTGERKLPGRKKQNGRPDATLHREGKRRGQQEGTPRTGDTRGAGAPTREATRGAYETRRTAARARRRSSATSLYGGRGGRTRPWGRTPGTPTLQTGSLPVAHSSASTSGTNDRPGKAPARLSEANWTESF